MINSETALDVRVEEVVRRLRTLEARVDELDGQLQALRAPRAPEAVTEEPEASGLRAPWSGTPVLPSIAAVCFLLVVALALRTLVDGGIVEPLLGICLGAAYAGLLILIGYFRYARMLRLAAVFASCGFLLLYSILLEGHARFGFISAPAAYAGLLAGLGAAAIPRRHRVPATALCIGILGAAVASVALEFPQPQFPLLAGMLLLANVAAYRARTVPRCGWLKWGVLGLTAFFWFLWVVRVRTWAARQGVEVGDVALEWLAPWLVAYTVLYVGTALMALRRPGGFGRFEAVLPSVASIGGYAVAQTALSPAWSVDRSMATAGVFAAAGFLILGARLARSKPRPRMRAAAAFVLPGTAILAVSLPGAMRLAPAFVCAAVAGLLIAMASIHWRSRPIRACSHALQAYACGAAIVAGALAVQSPLPAGRLLLAVVLGSLAAAHFGVCRHWKVRHDGSCLDAADPHDRSALLCVLASAAAFVAAARIVLFAVLGDSEAVGAFQCAQSAALSMAAAAIATTGLVFVSGELLVVALAVGLAAAGKVFGYDLFVIRGLPLVLSVFSFGVAAAFGSVVWARWQRLRA